MSAPFFAYTNKTYETGNGDHNVAKLDTSYSLMATRFYLDNFLNVEGVGVVGAVEELGENAKKHNLTLRKGFGRAGNMILLNDAGLHTYAIADSPYPSLEGGSVGINVTPMYYSTWHKIVLYWRNASSTGLFTATAPKLVTHAMKTSIVASYFGATEYGLPTSNDIEVYAIVENEEGFAPPTESVIIRLESDSADVSVSIASVTADGVGATVVINTDVALVSDITFGALWDSGASSGSYTLYSGLSTHIIYLPTVTPTPNSLTIGLFSPNPPHINITAVNSPYSFNGQGASVSGYLNTVYIISSPNYYRQRFEDGFGNMIDFAGAAIITMAVDWYDEFNTYIASSNETFQVFGAGSITTSSNIGTDKPSNYKAYAFTSVVDDGATTITGFTTGITPINGR